MCNQYLKNYGIFLEVTSNNHPISSIGISFQEGNWKTLESLFCNPDNTNDQIRIIGWRNYTTFFVILMFSIPQSQISTKEMPWSVFFIKKDALPIRSNSSLQLLIRIKDYKIGCRGLFTRIVYSKSKRMPSSINKDAHYKCTEKQHKEVKNNTQDPTLLSNRRIRFQIKREKILVNHFMNDGSHQPRLFNILFSVVPDLQFSNLVSRKCLLQASWQKRYVPVLHHKFHQQKFIS